MLWSSEELICRYSNHLDLYCLPKGGGGLKNNIACYGQVKNLLVDIAIHLNLSCLPNRGLEDNIACYGQVKNLSVDIAIHLNLSCLPKEDLKKT